MKLQFLGTAAAEGIPGLFCDCESCRRARALRGKNLRTRSQALVNDSLLIDFPSETYVHMNNNGLNLTGIHHLLITHVHMDHLYPADFANLYPSYAHLPEDWEGFHVYGSEDLEEKFAPLSEPVKERINLHVVEPYKPFAVGDMTVTALRANHGTPHPYIYLIEQGDKSLLYAHDTGLFTEETWEYLIGRGTPIDLVSFDCTGGAAEDLSYPQHMCLGRAGNCRDRMRDLGILTDRSIAVLNHFSHNGLLCNYDDFVDLAAARGFLTSYDSMTVEF